MEVRGERGHPVGIADLRGRLCPAGIGRADGPHPEFPPGLSKCQHPSRPRIRQAQPRASHSVIITARGSLDISEPHGSRQPFQDAFLAGRWVKKVLPYPLRPQSPPSPPRL